MQQTLVLVKPDGVRRALTGEILARIERVGLKLVALKMLTPDRALAEKHYTYEDIAARHGEAVRNQLLDFITSGPVVAAVFEGDACVEVIRKHAGATEPRKAAAGTIRGDYAHHTYEHSNAAKRSLHNVIHASATPEEAAREIAIWFGPAEIAAYRRCDESEHRLQ